MKRTVFVAGVLAVGMMVAPAAHAAPNAKCEANARNGVSNDFAACNGQPGRGESATSDPTPAPRSTMHYDPDHKLEGRPFRDFTIVTEQ